MTPEARISRQEYLKRWEHRIWWDIGQNWSKKRLDWMEKQLRDIWAARRELERLEDDE